MSAEARDIYQTWMDDCARLLMSQDLSQLAAKMIYPQHVETLDGKLFFAAPEDMERSIEEFHGFLTRQGVDRFLRICQTAQFDPEDERTITGRHNTYILQGANCIAEPYQNEMCLRFEDGEWRGAGIRALVENISVPVLSLNQLRDHALSRETEYART